MAENNGVQRDLGKLEAQVGSLLSQVGDLSVKVGAIDRTLSEAKGGWRILLLVGGAAGTLGGAIATLFAIFMQAPK